MTFSILGRVLVRASLASDGFWQIHQADKPYTFRPLASVGTVRSSDPLDEGRKLFNIIIGPLAIDIGVI